VDALVLATAGTTAWDEEGRVLGSRSIPLSPLGRGQMEQMAKQLGQFPVRVIYTGQSRHCLESARILARATGATVRCLRELSEVNQGLWEGLLRREVERTYPKAYRAWLREPCRVRPPAGESIVQAYERARAVLADLSRRHRGQVVTIVAPRLLRGLIRCCLRGVGPEAVWEACREEADWEVIRMPGEEIGRA